MKRKFITHKIGTCSDCDWERQDYNKNVGAMARYHALKNGHKTQVEQAYVLSYDFRKK